MRCGHSRLVFDAGTGLRPLGIEMSRENVLSLDLFLTHFHMDHLQGFPFFLPAYDPHCTMKLHMPPHADASETAPIELLMQESMFPVPFSKLPANIQAVPVNGPCSVGGAVVTNFPLNHPGGCVAYRVEFAGKAVVYMTDHEPYWRNHPNSPDAKAKDRAILDFIRGATMLIREAQYSAQEYPRHRGWGHGTFDDALADAIAGGTQRLAIFHHDPEHDDRFLEAQLARLQKMAPDWLEVMLAREGQSVELSA